MSEKFWIVLVVAVAVLLVVFILRRQLKSLVLKGMGMEAEVQTHSADSHARHAESTATKRTSVKISDFNQTGSNNVLDIGRDDVTVERTKQKGIGQKINVQGERPERKET